MTKKATWPNVLRAFSMRLSVSWKTHVAHLAMLGIVFATTKKAGVGYHLSATLKFLSFIFFYNNLNKKTSDVLQSSRLRGIRCEHSRAAREAGDLLWVVLVLTLWAFDTSRASARLLVPSFSALFALSE